MKLKLFAILLAVSATLSLNAVVVVNESGKLMILSGFGVKTPDGSTVCAAMSPIELAPNDRVDTDTIHTCPIDVMDVLIDDGSKTVNNLRGEGRLGLSVDEEGQIEEFWSEEF